MKSERVRRLSVTMAGDEEVEPHPAPPTSQEAVHISSSATEVTPQPLSVIPSSTSFDSKFSMMKFAMDHFRQAEARHVTLLCHQTRACAHCIYIFGQALAVSSGLSVWVLWLCTVGECAPAGAAPVGMRLSRS